MTVHAQKSHQNRYIQGSLSWPFEITKTIKVSLKSFPHHFDIYVKYVLLADQLTMYV